MANLREEVGAGSGERKKRVGGKAGLGISYLFFVCERERANAFFTFCKKRQKQNALVALFIRAIRSIPFFYKEQQEQ